MEGLGRVVIGSAVGGLLGAAAFFAVDGLTPSAADAAPLKSKNQSFQKAQTVNLLCYNPKLQNSEYKYILGLRLSLDEQKNEVIQEFQLSRVRGFFNNAKFGDKFIEWDVEVLSGHDKYKLNRSTGQLTANQKLLSTCYRLPSDPLPVQPF